MDGLPVYQELSDKLPLFVDLPLAPNLRWPRNG